MFHLYGKPCRLTFDQKKFLHFWYTVRPDGKRLYRPEVRRRLKGPIADVEFVNTPQGPRKHGELRSGDEVYATDGSITTVTAVFNYTTEDTYRIDFRDGGSVLASASHRWPIDEFTGSGRTRSDVTTLEMFQRGVTFERRLTSGRTKATKPGVARWRTLESPAVQGRECLSPLPPYLLGYWLGDGDATRAAISCGDEDLAALLPRIEVIDVKPRVYKTHGRANNVFFTGKRGGEQYGPGSAALRALGVLNNKHIPERYFTASASQRWDLLAGLVDSDGTVSPSGTVEIGLSLQKLADDVFNLAVSLGLMPTVNVKPITRCQGKEYGPHYRICFTPQPGDPVSKLPRKQARLKTEAIHRAQSRSRTITKITKVGNLPARCITVAHPSHSYLVGERNVPTLNCSKDPVTTAMPFRVLASPDRYLTTWQRPQPQ